MTTPKKYFDSLKLSILIIQITLVTSSCSLLNTAVTSTSNETDPSKLKSTATTSSTAITKKYKPNYTPGLDAELSIPYRSFDYKHEVQSIGFGSCADQNKPEPLWKVISQNKPDLFILTGDNIYASRNDDKPIINQYLKLNKIAEFRAFREQTPILATWDDHDYGQNDGGFDNPFKEEARQVFLNYWGYLKQTLPPHQKAIYHSRMFGEKNKKIQIILLDTRWDRSALVKNPEYNPESPQTTDAPPKIYLPNTDPKARILSDEQWAWFETELKKPANLRIIISSIQLIPNDHYFEKWGNFPLEKERFFKIFNKLNIKNAIVLSGDRHLSAISQTSLNSKIKLTEITASAINRPSRNKTPEVDSTYLYPSYLKPNFGLLNIDWKQNTVTAKILDESNQVQMSHVIHF